MAFAVGQVASIVSEYDIFLAKRFALGEVKDQNISNN